MKLSAVFHYFLDCVSKVQGGLLFVLAAGEEWRKSASWSCPSPLCLNIVLGLCILYYFMNY